MVKNMKTSTIIIGIILVIAVVYASYKGGVATCKGGQPAGKYDAFTQCLTDKGVVMYGAEWCPHSQNQKKMFGESWKYVNYVECAMPDKSVNEKCTEKGIKGYPTWDINGEFMSGELSFKQLSLKSGCELS